LTHHFLKNRCVVHARGAQAFRPVFVSWYAFRRPAKIDMT
jgi:hypothetical protein